MIRIENGDLRKIIPLCREDDYITLSVLLNICSGWSLVDNIKDPNHAIVFHSHGGFINYLGNDPDEDMTKEIAEAVIAYRSDRDFVDWVEFANYPEAIVPLIKDAFKEVESIERICWKHNKKNFMSAPIPVITENIVVTPIDASDFENQHLCNDILLFWNKTEEMIDNSIGTKAMDNEKIIASCTSVSSVNGHNEIDIMVNDQYRKQGIGYAVAYAFIKECYNRGEMPGWDCISNNSPSIALATKLGFKQVGRYKLLSWDH